MAAWVTLSSSAAWVKLIWRAAASKAGNPLSGGRLLFMTLPSHELFLSKQDKGSFVKHPPGSQIRPRHSVIPSGSSPMADISLHYSSKAPLAGTYTAFNQVLAGWRRRARERRQLATLHSRTIP